MAHFHPSNAGVAALVVVALTGCALAPADEAVDDAVVVDAAIGNAVLDAGGIDGLTAWLNENAAASDPEVRGLYHAYVDGTGPGARPWHLSTMVSAEVARFWLAIGEIERAIAVGDALLRWQHAGAGRSGDRLGGAFPSEIARTGAGYQPRYLYDSSDTLAVIEALLALEEATGDARYLEAAHRGGVWLRDVMAHGERYGVWAEPHRVPMKAVTEAGAFDNRIAVGRVTFWLPTLRRLARRVGDPTFAELAEHSWAFLSHAQVGSGAYADHYDPGYPAVPFDPARFRAFTADGAVVADDSLRAALGAIAGGAGAAEVARFLAWMPADRAGIPGYLGLDDGARRTSPEHPAWDDLISTALLAAVRRRAGLGPSATGQALLERSQGADGGWPWGWVEDQQGPVDTTRATMTGIWAVLDLTPR